MITGIKIARVNHAHLSERRNRERPQQANAILVMFGLGVTAIIIASLLAIHEQWLPGQQEREYRRIAAKFPSTGPD